jgi:hypothetical protein
MAPETTKTQAGGNDGAGLGDVACCHAVDTRVSTRNSPEKQSLVPSQRQRRLAEKVHALGSLPLAYLFAQLAAGADVAETVERYAGLPGDFIKIYGADAIGRIFSR